MPEHTPRLWSDFDGTAVSVARKTDPRNWSKYPLRGLAGYVDFLRGVQAGGVEVAGIVSRRPNIFIRRIATGRSILKTGCAEFFTDKSQVVHAGSEMAKGRFVVEQSRASTIGMLEDKPHKLGAVILGAMLETTQHPETPQYPIVLGVVDHRHSQKYIERLTNAAAKLSTNDCVIRDIGDDVVVETETGVLHVTRLEPYSQQAGEAFAQKLLHLRTSYVK